MSGTLYWKEKRLYHCFRYPSAHAGTFVSGNAPCWKENRLYHCFLNQSAHAETFESGLAHVGKKIGFIIVFLIICHPGLFVAGYAPCKKEKRLHCCFLGRSVHAGPFVSRYALC